MRTVHHNPPTTLEPIMQILLNTDSHFDGREPRQEHLESVVREVLGPFGERITKVEAHLTDADSTTLAGPGNIHCTLEARLVEHEPVFARHHAGTAGQAIHGALRKLSCVLASEFEKQDHRYATANHAPEQTTPGSAQASA